MRSADRDIPVIRANDNGQIIGHCSMRETGLVVEFIDGVNVTRSEFFNMFCCGCIIDAADYNQNEDDPDNYFIKKATIKTFRLEVV